MASATSAVAPRQYEVVRARVEEDGAATLVSIGHYASTHVVGYKLFSPMDVTYKFCGGVPTDIVLYHCENQLVYLEPRCRVEIWRREK